MKFESFLELASKIGNLPLPGRDVQLEMAPTERLKELEELEITKRNPRQAGVMCLFYPTPDGDTEFILILRKTYEGVHSNQVGFPGGKVELTDRNLAHTALRETEEEVGVPQSHVVISRKLTNIYIPPSNFWVQSFIGHLDHTPAFIAQESEVESLIPVPLSEFLSDDCITTQKLSTSYMDDMEVPAYKLQGHIVWGATAMMLSEVRSLLNTSLKL
ncbi:8-oxo-dGTP pyrophosphatase MutT (NUDIX family) [Dokdonia sp. Hel_I_63]|uniref:NUDIX hydrolase n=1 Tax=Dokdonia sp. Hel_I_63 TaxID=1249996 RepID=UPI00119A9C8E|nr:CoA pyrophosphatase [Dokdonia sp. Hel_I_63]TVZ23491.1 8-oxo-dGTP pyrophosphatase MutT (NUDIX family) [Dokdonia sp. Hel_I_63]